VLTISQPALVHLYLILSPVTGPGARGQMQVGVKRKDVLHFGVLKTCEPRDVGAPRTDWSPKRPRLTKLRHMLAQLAIGVGNAAIVPSEHDIGSASNGHTLIRPRLCRGERKLVSASVCNVPPAIRQPQNYVARRTPWRRLSSRSGRILWYSSELYQRLNAVSANSRMTMRFGSGPHIYRPHRRLAQRFRRRSFAEGVLAKP
jgi:hypothetical protein